MLQVLEITKIFNRRPVLDRVSFQVGNEVMVIVGRNGSGKSTLLRIIAGLLPPEGGAVLLGGRDVTGRPPEGRRVGYVPQRPALFPHLSVEENLRYSFQNGRGSPVLLARLIDLLDLRGVLSKKPGDLSGGFQSRISLARAVASQPVAVLLDEPLSALDAPTKEGLLPRFREVLKLLDVPVLYITHELREAGVVGDRFTVLQAGKVREVDAAGQAFALISSNFATFSLSSKMNFGSCFPSH